MKRKPAVVKQRKDYFRIIGVALVLFMKEKTQKFHVSKEKNGK